MVGFAAAWTTSAAAATATATKRPPSDPLQQAPSQGPSQAPAVAKVERFGLTEVHSPHPRSSARVDLVLVHGLNGDPHDTWTSRPSGVFWPGDLLPEFLREQRVRVLVYGFDADVASLGGAGASKDRIHNHAEALVQTLSANRRLRQASDRPLIFVAHSLGGLVVKRALVYSAEISGPKTEHLRSVYISTYAILFLGTPHHGSDLASWGSFLERLCGAIVPRKVLDAAPQLVDALRANGETLQGIDRQFTHITDRFHIFFFHEAKPSDLGGTMRFIVEEDSAAPNLPDVERAGIQADHSHMCKFDGADSPGFLLVVEAISRYADGAETVVGARWVAERQMRRYLKARQVQELVPAGPSDSSASLLGSPGPSEAGAATPAVIPPGFVPDLAGAGPGGPRRLDPPGDAPPYYFFVPPGFHENAFFVGMDVQLDEMDRRLFDARRDRGTATVLLHGQAGAGKSHLARQYVFANRDRFPGGIFWINARLVDEMYKEIWQIAQRYVARDAPDLRLGYDRGSFVEVVREWFEGRRGWLVVLDGVSDDREEDVRELQRFVPNSPGSSLVYLSRSRRLGTRQRLLRPHPIKVPRLTAHEGRELLFLEIPIAAPRPSQVEKANRLVREVDGLPLAIHAISHRLADTREPLERFAFRSYAQDPKLAATYRAIVDDLAARHPEAANLMNILCFLGPHIPVEMIRLGVGALRQERVGVSSSEAGRPPDLNSSFAILIRNALLERNEQDERAPAPGDPAEPPEPMDVLKLHMVVQKFCRDSLSSSGALPLWLSYAVSLFVQSFRVADRKIKRGPEPGRVSDYREYLVHGQRLRRHALDYGTKEPTATTTTTTLESIRSELDPVIADVREEIRVREPGSSRESVLRGRFQLSIFDRSGSSDSSSGRSEPRPPTPSYSVGEGIYGLALDGPAVDSPTAVEMRGCSPPEEDPTVILDYGTQAPFASLERRAARHGGRQVPLQKGWSGSTLKPDGASDGDDDGDNAGVDTAWQRDSGPLPPVEAGRPETPRCSSFLPFFSGPRIGVVDTGHATGSITRPPSQGQGDLTGSSDAVTALARMHQTSRPPPRGGRFVWSRSSSRNVQPWSSTRSSTPSSLPVRRSPDPSAAPFYPPSSHSPIQEVGRSRNGSLARDEDRQSPLPFETIAEPQRHPPFAAAQPGRATGRGVESALPRNLHHLRHLSAAHAPYSFHEAASFDWSLGPGAAAAGYYSTPVSRDISRQSHQSVLSAPAAEPPWHASGRGQPSPLPSSFTPPPGEPPTSLRIRRSNASSPNHSPRPVYAAPSPLLPAHVPTDLFSGRPGPPYRQASPAPALVVAGAGGQFGPETFFAGGARPGSTWLDQPFYPPTSESVTRPGSGPGVALEGPRGLGLSVIAEFGADPDALVFGSQEPFSMTDAEHRRRLWADQLRERQIDHADGNGRARAMSSGGGGQQGHRRMDAAARTDPHGTRPTAWGAESGNSGGGGQMAAQGPSGEWGSVWAAGAPAPYPRVNLMPLDGNAAPWWPTATVGEDWGRPSMGDAHTFEARRPRGYSAPGMPSPPGYYYS